MNIEQKVNALHDKAHKDPDLMDMMKRLTLIKRKVEKRLKGRPGS